MILTYDYWWDEKPEECDLRRVDWRIEVPDGNGSWKTLRLPGLEGDSTLAVDSKGLDLKVYCCRENETGRVIKWMKSHGEAEPTCKRLWCVEWEVRAPKSLKEFRFAPNLSGDLDTTVSLLGHLDR